MCMVEDVVYFKNSIMNNFNNNVEIKEKTIIKAN